MTDADLVRKKLAFIEACVAEPRRRAPLDDLLAHVVAVRARLSEAGDD